MKSWLKKLLIVLGAAVLLLVLFVGGVILYSATYSIPEQAASIENATGLVQAHGRSLYDAAGNRLALKGINAGQILLHTDLKPINQRHGFNSIIPSGQRAISIPVDTTGAVTNLVGPNDNVDVIGTFRFPDLRGDSSLDTVTLTILQNVKVLAVGNRWGAQQYADQSASNRGYSTVTLLVWPEEVEMLVFASQKGRLSLSLRNFDDARIDRALEGKSVNFKELEKNIPSFNEQRRKRQQYR